MCWAWLFVSVHHCTVGRTAAGEPSIRPQLRWVYITGYPVSADDTADSSARGKCCNTPDHKDAGSSALFGNVRNAKKRCALTFYQTPTEKEPARYDYFEVQKPEPYKKTKKNKTTNRALAVLGWLLAESCKKQLVEFISTTRRKKSKSWRKWGNKDDRNTDFDSKSQRISSLRATISKHRHSCKKPQSSPSHIRPACASHFFHTHTHTHTL